MSLETRTGLSFYYEACLFSQRSEKKMEVERVGFFGLRKKKGSLVSSVNRIFGW